MGVHLDLTDEQQQLLRDILETEVSDLRMEIRETDTREFKDMLKEKEQEIGKLLEALGEEE